MKIRESKGMSLIAFTIVLAVLVVVAVGVIVYLLNNPIKENVAIQNETGTQTNTDNNQNKVNENANNNSNVENAKLRKLTEVEIVSVNSKVNSGNFQKALASVQSNDFKEIDKFNKNILEENDARYKFVCQFIELQTLRDKIIEDGGARDNIYINVNDYTKKAKEILTDSVEIKIKKTKGDKKYVQYIPMDGLGITDYSYKLVPDSIYEDIEKNTIYFNVFRVDNKNEITEEKLGTAEIEYNKKFKTINSIIFKKEAIQTPTGVEGIYDENEISDIELKSIVQKYLDITYAGAEERALEMLGFVFTTEWIEIENIMWQKTSIKYEDYKSAVLNLVSEDFFDKFALDKQKDGYLLLDENAGDVGAEVEIENIERKSKNVYSVNFKSRTRGNNEEETEDVFEKLIVTIEKVNEKYVISNVE